MGSAENYLDKIFPSFAILIFLPTPSDVYMYSGTALTDTWI